MRRCSSRCRTAVRPYITSCRRPWLSGDRSWLQLHAILSLGLFQYMGVDYPLSLRNCGRLLPLGRWKKGLRALWSGRFFLQTLVQFFGGRWQVEKLTKALAESAQNTPRGHAAVVCSSPGCDSPPSTVQANGKCMLCNKYIKLGVPKSGGSSASTPDLGVYSPKATGRHASARYRRLSLNGCRVCFGRSRIFLSMLPS